MRPEAEHTFRTLEEIDVFSKVGTCQNSSVSLVHSSAQAKRCYSTRKWENLKNSVSNRTTKLIYATGKVSEEEVNLRSEPVVQRIDQFSKNSDILFRNISSDPYLERMVWLDLRMIICDIEFADVCDPVFAFSALFPWYKKGYMPCGGTER